VIFLPCFLFAAPLHFVVPLSNYQSPITMITSLTNPRIKAAKALQQRRQREREGLILVEGLRLVGDALAAGLAPQTLFYTADATKAERGAALIDAAGRQAEEVSEAVLASIAETVTPQGIVAVFPLPVLPWPATPTLLLVCDELRDPGNLGTLARAAAGAGADGILLPKGTVDPWNGKALRASMGALFRLPVRAGLAWAEVEVALTGLQVRLAEASGSISYDQADWTQPSALIIGGEAAGASQAAAARADQRIAIPLAHEVESLNAAMAGSIILFEARRQRRAARL
jgi:TrmH family RNA methyltransferase